MSERDTLAALRPNHATDCSFARGGVAFDSPHCPLCEGLAAGVRVAPDAPGLRERLRLSSSWMHEYEKHGGAWESCNWQSCELDRAAYAAALALPPRDADTRVAFSDDSTRRVALAAAEARAARDALDVERVIDIWVEWKRGSNPKTFPEYLRAALAAQPKEPTTSTAQSDWGENRRAR